MFRNLKADSLIFSEKWPTCFAITNWWIWKWRNFHLFGNNKDVPLDTGAFLRHQDEETWSSLSTPWFENLQHSRHLRQQIFVRWLAPLNECFILNTDEASKGSPGPAGGDGVIRSNRGEFVKAFSSKFGICSAFNAEVMAIKLGLEMARELDIMKLKVQMDNEACIVALNNPSYQGGECFHLFNQCRKLITSSSWEIAFKHCYREGNKVADKLANVGVSQLESVVYYESPQGDVVSLLREDLMGVTTPCLV
ncbi:hypothetical protein RDABS01_009610 [Bienertia sinuspersici]